MSYIKHKDRVFLKKGRNAVRKRSDTSLRRISSCGDVRAWSACPDDKRQYFLDSVTSKSNKSFGKYIPPDVIIDILQKQNSVYLKRVNALKRCSSDDHLKKKDGLLKKKSRTSLLNKVKSKEDITKTHEDAEVSNLRLLIKDLESKLSSMESVEEENLKLKAQISHGIDNIETLNALAVNPFFHSQAPSASGDLSNAVDVMRSQYKEMQLNMEYLQSKNFKLSNKLKKCSSNEKRLRNRELGVSLETVNNAILKSKVSSKDMKIQKLQTLSEEQKVQIENLVCHINELSVHFSWKEEMLVGKLLELKNVINTSSSKALECENKIMLYQNVVQEMDVLGHNFRRVNAALKEEAVYYKSKLKTVACKVLEMTDKIECLLDEIAIRDAKIKDLTKFPGRAALSIRLNQLDNILNSDFLYASNANSVIETFDRLKVILKHLKKDAWESYGLEDPVIFSDQSSQSYLEIKDSCSQSAPILVEVEIQTYFPDQFLVVFLTYVFLISIFNHISRKIKWQFLKSQKKNKNLKSRLVETTCELDSKKSEIENLSNLNIVLQNNLDELKNQALKSSSHAVSILESSDNAISACELLNDLYNSSLQSTVTEYESYCDLLECIIESNEEKLSELSGYIKTELDEQRWQYFRYLSELEKKNTLLSNSFAQELHVNSVLLEEIDSLTADLVERDKFINKIKYYWLKAESEKEELSQVLFVQKEECDTGSQIGIDIADNEAMTDFKDIVREYADKFAEANFQCFPVHIHKSSKKIVKRTSFEDRNLKKKMNQVNFNVRRIKLRIISLRNKLEISVEALNKLKETNQHLTETNRLACVERNKLRNKITKLREIIVNLRGVVHCESSKNNKLQNDQINFFNDFQRIQSELLKLKDSTVKRTSENSNLTDLTMNEIELQLKSKDDCIQQLRDRVEKLLDLLKDIEEEKQIKENNLVNGCTQCDIKDSAEDKYQKWLNEVKENYENLINNMKQSFSEEKDNKEVYYRKNLSLLKDTYERDIKRIKVSNAESLKKIQKFHEEEIKAIKKSQEEAKAKSEQKNHTFIQEKHSLELEQLRINYEEMIKEKSDLFLKEKEHLQDEMKKYMTEKECQVEEITKRMEQGIKNMKKKCKQHLKKLQYEKCFALEELRKQYSAVKVEDSSSVDLSDVYSSSQDKEPSLAESEDTLCEKGDCEGVTTDTSGFEEDHFDCVIEDERRYLLKRIEQLEDQVAEKQMQSSENACDSEKRVWQERERCREIRKLLEGEVEKNEKLRALLKVEKSRADHLTMLNQTLVVKLQKLELRGHDHKNPFSMRICDKAPSAFGYNSDHYDSYVNSELSDMTSCDHKGLKLM